MQGQPTRFPKPQERMRKVSVARCNACNYMCCSSHDLCVSTIGCFRVPAYVRKAVMPSSSGRRTMLTLVCSEEHLNYSSSTMGKLDGPDPISAFLSRAGRLKLQLPISFHADGKAVGGESVDLSESGVCGTLRTDPRPHADSTVD